MAASQSSSPRMAELTLRVVILGVVLAVVMGAANVYLGLKAGMTVSASIPAAVIGMLILKGLFRNGTILEANQVQTAASAGESLAAGIIFTMPALILIGVWKDFDVFMTTIIAFTGGLLGILFMIPMRRVFVVRDVPELTYPEGVACAAVLEAGDSDTDGGGGAMAIVKGAAIGGVIKVMISFIGIMRGSLEGAFSANNRIFFFGGDVSPALIAVGYIVRLNVAILIFIGGAMAWLIGIPLLGDAASHADPMEGAWALWSGEIRYVGVGAMVVGGIAAIVKVRHGLVAAVQEIRKKRDETLSENERDMSSGVIMFWSVVASVLVGVVYFLLTKNIMITIVTTVIMLVMSLFFTAVASYIVGLVGNSNSPVSGMTITAVLFTGGLLYVFGFAGEEGMIATLGVAAIVCCAACTSGDVCNDLKTGQLVGASPFRQQIMQIVGVASASLVMAPVLQLLHDNTEGGIGGPELSAPQAGLFAALADGFFGDSTLPWNLVIIGAVIGVIMVAIDYVLEKKGSSFRAHVMPIAVGMYLPFTLAPPILIGGLLAHFMTKKDNAKTDEEKEKSLRRGVLFSSGTIAGEALMGVGLAIAASAGLAKLDVTFAEPVTFVVTAVVTFALIGAFWFLSQNKKEA